MRKGITLSVIIYILCMGCASQKGYKLHAFYISKNNSLNLVSKLAIYNSGSYNVCTSTLEHQNDHPGDGKYSCVEGVWKQEKDMVLLTPNTDDGKPLFTFSANEGNSILKQVEKMANPTALKIQQSSGGTMSDVSKDHMNARGIRDWSNYQRTESF